MTDDEAATLKIKVNLFQKFSEVIKFKELIINPAWIWKHNHSLVLLINMKFINLIKAQMKKIKSKHDEALILKLVMSFTIHNECYIKDKLTMKTANLMAKYISANIYHMSIFRTPININLKSIKTYSDLIL